MTTDTAVMTEDRSVVDKTPVSLMDSLVRTTPERPEVDTLIDGVVIAKDKMAMFVDLPPFGTGLIFGREYLNARDLIKKINIGDTVTAKIVATEGENGYLELSLKEAKQAILWDSAERAMKNKEIFSLVVREANKGGLILDWQGIDGFVPASQLKPDHYPRVPDGDKDKIADELAKLVGSPLEVSIIGIDPKEGKLIFSEKTLDSKSRKEIVNKYVLGDVVEGEVTGAVDFGVFLKIEEGLEGLVHISELDWSLVEDPRSLYKPGDKIKAKIIEIKEDKISLSIKALKTNPWHEAEKKYHKGDLVSGVVIKYNKHGALIAIEEGVAGLVHISEFTDESDLRSKLELGKTYNFTINLFEPKEQRMTLVFGDRREEILQAGSKKTTEQKA
ncbi:MAG: hypothetical protein A2589_02575 [Candidatus Vogelbacteria bacterium RIFOXYD1_FULL_46_19]|uniref:S1 motif domain-containing protein n=1 Tax=Candidatus Vogelbacteria bacterium RIFOXYD1_FULL_46_19 TaxID=1802439 RepID=A0A1G2QIT5_9BACT|nr:MAG: hypothetical protein A2589_02575 [Candidatus Vogelbacteria bacterium RIFOXYD1_FULL_46_19]